MHTVAVLTIQGDGGQEIVCYDSYGFCNIEKASCQDSYMKGINNGHKSLA